MEKEPKFNFLNTLAAIVVIGIFIFFFWICKANADVEKPNPNIGEVKTALIAALFLILNWYYGSSKSSQKKDETIQAMQQVPKVNAENVNAENVETVNTNNVNVQSEKN